MVKVMVSNEKQAQPGAGLSTGRSRMSAVSGAFTTLVSLLVV
jgi:hypothetical protein